jgi:hypothetical protein
MPTKIDNNDTMHISPRRVFQCVTEKRLMERKDVWKDAFGRYHCTHCGEVVVDKTDTTTGHDFMELVLI